MQIFKESLIILTLVFIMINSFLFIRRELNKNANQIKIENKGYFILLSSGDNYYLTDEQYLKLQEAIKLNNKTYTFVSKAKEEKKRQVDKEEIYTIFLDKIVHIYKEKKIEN